MSERRMRTTFGRLRLILPGLAVLLLGAGRVEPPPRTDVGASEPPLVEAARRDLGVDALRDLLQQGVDVNEAYGDGSTALHWVSHWDDVESAELLIRAGADVNAANDLGATPLWSAALNGNPVLTQKLLAAGANPNAKLARGETVLMQAARSGDPEVVAQLLAAGADVNARGPIQDVVGPCPLPDVYAFQPLIPNTNHGLTPEELERISGMQCGLQAGNQTALMWAAANRHPEVVALLIEGGADIHARSDVWAQVQAAENPHAIYDLQRSFLNGGMTALLQSARVGGLASAKLLVAAGAEVNDTDARGVTALALATWAADMRVLRDQGLDDEATQLVTFLLESGADPNVTTGEYSPLHVAVMSQNERMVGLLLEYGADPNAPLRGWTPASRGPIAGYRNFSYAIVGSSPLWLAARFSTPDIMRLLKEHGADPLFVHTSNFYGGGGGGIDTNFNTEHLTILMAAVGQGGSDVSGWPGTREGELSMDARRRAAQQDAADALALEKVKLAVEWGVDVNAVNEATNTCVVPWADTYRPGARKPCDGSVEVTRSTAIEGARGNEAVVEYLVEQGAPRPAPEEPGFRRRR